MPGLYDNETGKYLYQEHLDKGDWFEDEEGFLYIIPRPDVVAEIDGPDNAIMVELNRLCREHGGVSDEDAERLGFTRVDDVLKRFSDEDGFYHA